MENSQYIDVLKRLRNYTHKHGLATSYELFNQLLDATQRETGQSSVQETVKTSEALQALKDNSCFDRLHKITAKKMDTEDCFPTIGSYRRFEAAVTAIYAGRAGAANMCAQDTMETAEERRNNTLALRCERSKIRNAYEQQEVSVFTRPEVSPTQPSGRTKKSQRLKPLVLTREQVNGTRPLIL